MRVGILILSHGRADNVKTWALLDKRRSNLERKIVVDDEDEQLDEYRKRFGDNVIVFSKSNYMAKSDTFAPRSDRPRGIVLPARNACPDIAAALGWDYFIELDDDYDNIDTRYIDGGKLKGRNLENVDDAFTEMAKFLEKSGTDVIALAHGDERVLLQDFDRYTVLRVPERGLDGFRCSRHEGRFNSDVHEKGDTPDKDAGGKGGPYRGVLPKRDIREVDVLGDRSPIMREHTDDGRRSL